MKLALHCVGNLLANFECAVCRNTKTQVNPSSALNRTKHHQSNPSIVPGILDSNLSRRACMHSSKFLITWSNRITSYDRIRFFNWFPSFRFYYFPGLLNLCCKRQRGLPLLFREAGFTAPSGTYSGRRPTIRDLNLHSHLLLTGTQVAELTLTAFRSESGLPVTQRPSLFP